MRILGLSIQNFRGIRSADIRLPEHALLVGPNNASKTTILDALDLVLGPDRARGPDAVDEHDFYRGSYYDVELSPEGESADDTDSDQTSNFSEIQIVATIGQLSSEDLVRFRRHVEPWHHDEFRPLTPEEAEAATIELGDLVLRVGFRAWYDVEEDDFDTQSFFVSPEHEGGRRDAFGRRNKLAVGFVYLRSLRTARRAASLNRGSLLDLLLRTRTPGTQLWESLIRGMRQAGRALADNDQVRDALNEVQQKITELIPLADMPEGASTLQVSRLTRKHLRDTITYFLASHDSEHSLPFDHLGSGTSNVLVFALLSAIAEAKDNVIFAMEEPEIALPPHTQRLMTHRLKRRSAQALVTSHSPYVAELFLPTDILVVRRASDGAVKTQVPKVDATVKRKALRRGFRTRFAEGMLARAVLLVEGVTELWALPVVVDLLAQVEGTAITPWDLDGLVVVPCGGSGELAKLGHFFRSVGISAHTFCDTLDPAELAEITAAVDSCFEHPYGGFEDILAQELEETVLRRVVRACESWPEYPKHVQSLPDQAPEADWRDRCKELLGLRKGEAWAARLIEELAVDELPMTLLKAVATLRGALGHPPLPHDDPLAELFRSVDRSFVQPAPDGGTDEESGNEAESSEENADQAPDEASGQ